MYNMELRTDYRLVVRKEVERTVTVYCAGGNKPRPSQAAERWQFPDTWFPAGRCACAPARYTVGGHGCPVIFVSMAPVGGVVFVVVAVAAVVVVLGQKPGHLLCGPGGVEWNVKVWARPRPPPASSPASGLLDCASSPGSGGRGGESAVDAAQRVNVEIVGCNGRTATSRQKAWPPVLAE
nr:unnamed protein product [Spirometra erinaceieuropaei]